MYHVSVNNKCSNIEIFIFYGYLLKGKLINSCNSVQVFEKF